ncbi:hypothetical protein, partial [Rhodococcus jostii]|uniref:hypothetical protein n=1 Tax=Rhodococcus jostii TaxID=132919 RepID=UPI001C3F9349
NQLGVLRSLLDPTSSFRGFAMFSHLVAPGCRGRLRNVHGADPELKTAGRKFSNSRTTGAFDATTNGTSCYFTAV